MTTLPAVTDTPPAKRSFVHISRCQTIVGFVCRLIAVEQRRFHYARNDPASMRLALDFHFSKEACEPRRYNTSRSVAVIALGRRQATHWPIPAWSGAAPRPNGRVRKWVARDFQQLANYTPSRASTNSSEPETQPNDVSMAKSEAS